MPKIKLNLRPNLLRLFRYLSAIILNYFNQFRKRSIHVSNIRKEDIYKIFNNANKGGKYSANKTLKLINAILNIAVELELIEKNPANGIKIHKMQARDRYITLEEMPRFLAAVEEDKNPYLKYFVYISLYTAARRNNVLSMRWENIRLEEGV
ncbi:integrase [Orientia tsutsugamushi]|nr:integrase [Orientia tsutsugamushi]